MKIASLSYVIFLGFFASLLNLGCSGGMDVKAIPLNKDWVINYGKLVYEGKAPVEAVVYGQILPGDSATRGRKVLDAEIRDMTTGLAQFRDMTKLYSFDATAEGNFLACVDTLQVAKQKLTMDIGNARKSPSGAKDLAGVVEPYVKTGGRLEVDLNDCRANVPAAALADFAAIATPYLNSVNRIYQTAIALAQVITQSDAHKEISKIEIALTSLLENISPILFTTQAKRDVASQAILDATNKNNTVRTYNERLVSINKIGADFNNAVTDLQSALARVKTNYVDAIDAAAVEGKAAATASYNACNAAEKVLMQLARDYIGGTGIEGLKDTRGDAKLDDLITKAFSGSVPVLLGEINNDSETSVVDLARMLADKSYVVAKQDGSSAPLTWSLASSVMHKLAVTNGLESDNVVGLDVDAVIKYIDANFTENENVAEFSRSLAEKLRESQTKDGKYKNVYVILNSDRLAERGADINGMAAEFLKANGHPLVFAHDTSKYEDRAAPFVAKEMDVAAAVLVGNAILEQYKNLPVSITAVSERVARIAAGFSPSFNLGEISLLMKDAGRRISQKKNPTSAEIDEAVIASLSDNKIDTSHVASSGILLHDLSKVKSNLKSNRSFYSSAGRGWASGSLQQDLAQRKQLDDLAKQRAEEDAIRRDADAKYDDMKQAVREAKDALAQKNSDMNIAKTRVQGALMRDGADVDSAFNEIKTTAANCAYNTANLLIKFPLIARQALLDGIFQAPTLGSDEDKAIKGTPDFTVGTLNNSWASCIVEEARVNAISTILDDNKRNIQQALTTLSSSASACFDQGDMAICLTRAIKQYEDFRKLLVAPAARGTALSEKVVQRVKLAELDLTKAANKREILWRTTTVPPLTAAIPSSFGDFIEKASTKNPSEILAHKILNQHYYLKSLLEVTGTAANMANLTADLSAPTNVAKISDPTVYTPGSSNTMERSLLVPLLDAFDNDKAILVKARRKINKEYHHVVAAHLARVVVNEIIDELNNRVVKRFWSLPIAKLKLFQETSATPESIARKDIWTKFNELTALIEDITMVLNKNFVQQGDGNAAPADPKTTGLEDLIDAVAALHAKADAIEKLLIPGAGNAFNGLDAALVTELTNTIKTPLDNFVKKTDLGTNSTFASPYAAMLPGAPIADRLWKLAEIAYDLHVFNYFDKLGAPLAGAGSRVYPAWHSLLGSGDVKHPLE